MPDRLNKFIYNCRLKSAFIFCAQMDNTDQKTAISDVPQDSVNDQKTAPIHYLGDIQESFSDRFKDHFFFCDQYSMAFDGFNHAPAGSNELIQWDVHLKGGKLLGQYGYQINAKDCAPPPHDNRGEATTKVVADSIIIDFLPDTVGVHFYLGPVPFTRYPFVSYRLGGIQVKNRRGGDDLSSQYFGLCAPNGLKTIVIQSLGRAFVVEKLRIWISTKNRGY